MSRKIKALEDSVAKLNSQLSSHCIFKIFHGDSDDGLITKLNTFLEWINIEANHLPFCNILCMVRTFIYIGYTQVQGF